MASIDFLTKRIEGKEKELVKLNKKLERIRKVEAQGWADPNPYYYSARDLQYTLRDIDAAQKALDDYRLQLQLETEKANSRNVPAIVEFLDKWKERMLDTFESSLTDYYAEQQYVRELYRKLPNVYAASPEKDEYDAASHAFHSKRYGYYEKREYTNRFGKLAYNDVKVADGEYEWLKPYCDEPNITEALKKVEKDLTREWNRKYDFIIERTCQIVGTITDASNLFVGAKGDLNGYIIGTNGKAKVQTIGAGGYNIQCFHFRTLISRMA